MTVAGLTLAAVGAPRFRLHNQVAATLVFTGAAATMATGFVIHAANRLVSGHPIALWNAAPAILTVVIALFGAALLGLSAMRPSRVAHLGQVCASLLLLIAVLAAAGTGAKALAADAPAAAAISLGAGFWVILACAALALIDALQRVEAGAPVQLVVVLLVVGVFFTMAEAGLFGALSLAREYMTRRDVFTAAVVRHIELVVAAIVPALLIGAPLALVALRRKRFEAPLFTVLNLLQTVPSIALFGLLIAPLSALASAVPFLAAIGVAGVGPAPAIIALVLYALLPIARNTFAGIGGVSPSTIDAARGMGMTDRQIFWEVEVPLALPVLLAGLRIVMVQAIGLTVVAALIGAGGLGGFVFDGLGQYATDLVLLGALPAIALALAADFLLRLASAGLRRRYTP